MKVSTGGAVTGLRSAALSLAVFAVVSMVLLVGLFRLMSNQAGGSTRTWTAQFVSVSGLRVGDDVRVAGVEVGRVDAIEVTDAGRAAIRFEMAADQPVHEATRLTLRYQNLLGQRYLALTVPPGDRGPERAPGSTIPVEQTSPGFDLTELLNGFEPLFAVLDPGAVNDLAANLVAVLQGESGTVESLLDKLGEATGRLADRDQVFGEVLDNLVPVLEQFDERSADLDATVVQFRRLMSGLAAERATFAHSIDHLGGLVESTADLLETLRPSLRSTVGSLRDTTDLLVDQRERLGTALERLPQAAGGLGRSMSYGNMLNVYLCNLGLTVGDAIVWVGGSGGPYGEVCR